MDITAGQFNEVEKSIIIDEHGSWHNKFFYELDAYTPVIDFENYVDAFDQPILENDCSTDSSEFNDALNSFCIHNLGSDCNLKMLHKVH